MIDPNSQQPEGGVPNDRDRELDPEEQDSSTPPIDDSVADIDADAAENPDEPENSHEPEDASGFVDLDDLDDEQLEEELARARVPAETLENLPVIPDALHSVFEGGPFSKCNVCEKLLIDRDQVYHVEKVFRHQECIFEMALCLVCAMNLHKQYSKESKQALKEFFSQGYERSGDIEHCHLCREPASETNDRVMTAACARDRLVMPVVVVCNKCVERSQELLSSQTKESYGDFIENHFPGVPAEWEPAPTALV